METDKPSVKKNYLYILAYRVLSIIAPLITAPYVSRVLGVDNIGIFSFVNANASYFILFGVFGLSSYSQFECAKRRDDVVAFSQFCVESILSRFLLMGISICIYICLFVCNENEYSVYYSILIFSLMANVLDFTWICEGLEKYKTITMRNSIVKLISIIAIFIFVKNSNDLKSYFYINAVFTLLGNVALIPYVKQYISVGEISRVRVVPHIKSAIIYFLPSAGSVILATADKIMIGCFTGDVSQNGCYEQAVKIQNIIFMIFASLFTSMRGRMAYLYAAKKEEARYYLNKSLSVILFLALPICFGLLQISGTFVPWFFGEGYDGAIVLLQVMAGWILIKSISGCLWDLAIFFAGDVAVATTIIWIGTILNVILNFLMIPVLGALGAALTSLISEVVVLIFVVIYAREKIDYKELKTDTLKEFFCSIVMFCVMATIKDAISNRTVLVVAEIILGTLTYVLLIASLRVSILNEVFTIMKSNIKH